MAEEDTVLQNLITRDQMFSLMECADGEAHLIGEGFTDLSESKGAKEYTRKYVSYKTEVTDVIGFAPSISYSCDVISGDPVVKEIIDITDNEKTGADAHRNIITVNGWEEQTEPGKYKAYRRKYAVIPDSKGSGTEALIYTGTFKARGDLEPGVFDTATKTFTPNSTPAA